MEVTGYRQNSAGVLERCFVKIEMYPKCPNSDENVNISLPFCAKAWQYRGEGNSSLVLANTEDHVVYRLRKRKCCQKGKGALALGPEEISKEDACKCMKQKLQNNIDFAEIVMSSVIGRHFVQAGVLVQLPHHFPAAINKRLKSLDVRPSLRLHQEVDENCLYAQCLPDFCYLLPKAQPNAMPVFSVEIKPKCGFIPTTAQISDDNSVKHSTCLFCMYQYLKLYDGRTHERSHYCPLDLFSGEPSRMKYALQALFSTPQNNLRMFKNGQVVWSEERQNGVQSDLESYFPSTSISHNKRNENSYLDGFLDVLVRCLLHVPDSTSYSLQEDRAKFPRQHCLGNGMRSQQSELENEDAALPEECVLGHILRGQMLDSLGIEVVYPLYERVKSHLDKYPDDRETYCIDGPYNKHSWKILNHDNDDGSVDYAIQKVKEYLMSRTAKDCSLMIAIQPMTNKSKKNHHPSGGLISTKNGKKYQFAVSVIDLDPKPWDKLPKYSKQDQEIVDHYKANCTQNISPQK